MGNTPSAPRLTENNLPDQTGKVFFVTGATSGIGLSLIKILYSKNANIWIAARSANKAQATIAKIKADYPQSSGKLDFVIADFNDLTTIKGAVNDFLARETRLDVLWNNAGIMIPPKGTLSKQGYEAQMGVNTLAPFLLTKLLTPALQQTASEKGSASRVVWVSSSAAERFAPPGGIEMATLDDQRKDKGQWFNYGTSKAGTILHASEYAKLGAGKGVISVSADPGNLDTDLYQNMGSFQHWVAKKVALKPAIYGAYTELYAGLSSEIGQANDGGFVIPWGKVGSPRDDIVRSCKSKKEGGTDLASKFWEWSEKQVAPYV